MRDTERIEDESPSYRVIEEVAALKGKEPWAVDPPLCEAIEPEALDALFATDRRRPGQVSFTYSDCRITVGESGSVIVQEQSADDGIFGR